MAPPLILRIITDATAALKTNEAVIASNTAVGRSALNEGKDMELAARAAIAANVKKIESARAYEAEVKRLALVMKASGDDEIAISQAVVAAEARRNAALGVTAVGTARAGESAKIAERDFGKLTRGALAGSGVFAALGRSLAFASTGFIAVAGGATLIAESIRKAEDLAAAQRKADQQLKTSDKSWEQYGTEIDSVLLKEGHLAGFTRTELLGAFTFLLRVGGNVQNSLRLTGLAADVARGRGISLTAASIALSKALGGSATALRRLGIVVPNNVSKMAALNYVQAKFTGQAEAGTTASERLSASLSDAEATIGTRLLPTFDRIAEAFAGWLQKMQESGRLAKDTDEVIKLVGAAFHTLGGIIHTVDKVTGSFQNTVELLLALKFASVINKAWIPALVGLAKKFGLVAAAAETATAAEGAAGGGAVVAGGAAAGAGAAPLVAGAAAFGFIAYKGLTAGTGPSKVVGRAGNAGGTTQVLLEGVGTMIKKDGQWYRMGRGVLAEASQEQADQAEMVLEGQQAGPVFTGAQPTNAQPGGARFLGGTTGVAGARAPNSSAYGVPLYLQIDQAQAALTRTVKDNVAVAERILKIVKDKIAKGGNTQKRLLSLLQVEADALSVIQQADDAAKAKIAARKAAAEAAASTFEVPLYLQLAQAKAEAFGKSETSILKKIIAAAEKAIASGKKNLKGLIAAYQAIAAARSALAQQAQDQLIPLRLQLQLAKAQATGGDQTKILLKMRAALYKALKAAKGNIQKQIDIWNQIAAINSQLGNSITNAYGDYKKASLKAEVEGLGLTAAQRRALEARLSQRGPGGTVPSTGTGAAGYIIDPDTGRPVKVRHGRHPGQSGNVPGGGGGGGTTLSLRQTLTVNVIMDGKKVARVVTKHQQKYRGQNPSSRRGPHTATATA